MVDIAYDYIFQKMTRKYVQKSMSLAIAAVNRDGMKTAARPNTHDEDE